MTNNTFVTSTDIIKWSFDNSDHQFNFVADAELIANNGDISDLVLSVSIYANYLVDKSGQHEDFIRDACDRLVDSDSLYKDYFVDAYRNSQDAEMTHDEIQNEIDYNGIQHDDLISYFALNDMTDQKAKLNFTYSFLACLANDTSITPPCKINAAVLENKMVDAFRNIAD